MLALWKYRLPIENTELLKAIMMASVCAAREHFASSANSLDASWPRSAFPLFQKTGICTIVPDSNSYAIVFKRMAFFCSRQ
jgi:hypothetical protein